MNIDFRHIRGKVVSIYTQYFSIMIDLVYKIALVGLDTGNLA